MDRRSFLRLSAAAVAAAGENLSWIWNKPEFKFDLRQFCDDSDIPARFDLNSPFEQRGWTYATDARICVRTQLQPADDAGKALRLPKADSLCWEELDAAGGWKPWPKMDYVAAPDDDHKCFACHGKGRVGLDVKRCPICDGDSPFYAEQMGKLCECSKKLRTGRYELGFIGGTICGYCEGEGVTRKPTLQPFGSGKILLSGSYDQKIRSLGEAEYRIVVSGKAGEMVGFRFAGGQGFVATIVTP